MAALALKYLLTLILMIGGLAAIFAGVTFINGQLLPALGPLARLYDAVPSSFGRTLIALPVFFLAANLLVAKAYMVGGPAAGSMCYIIATVLASVTTAMLVEGVRLNWLIIAGTLGVLAFALLVIQGINRQDGADADAPIRSDPAPSRSA